MKIVNLLDAYAILKYFRKEKGYEIVSSMLKAAQKKQTRLIMSEINMGEVYYQLYKTKNLPQQNHIWNLFLLLLITRCSIDWSLIIEWPGPQPNGAAAPLSTKTLQKKRYLVSL